MELKQKQVLITIWILGNPECLRSVADWSNITKSILFLVYRRICGAIAYSLFGQYMKYPLVWNWTRLGKMIHFGSTFIRSIFIFYMVNSTFYMVTFFTFYIGQCKTQTADCRPGVKCWPRVKCRLKTADQIDQDKTEVLHSSLSRLNSGENISKLVNVICISWIFNFISLVFFSQSLFYTSCVPGNA